ncbi:MAG: hypothetical protein ACLFQK_02035 [Fibrobacterota bacterium]
MKLSGIAAIVFFVLVLAALPLLKVWKETRIVEAVKENYHLREKLSNITDSLTVVNLKIANESSLDKIEKAAKEDLGLKFPEDPVLILNRRKELR